MCKPRQSESIGTDFHNYKDNSFAWKNRVKFAQI